MMNPADPPHNVSIDPHTLEHLGPLRTMAGLYISHSGSDTRSDGVDVTAEYRDEIVLAPTDPFTNDSQLLYGLRYLQHVRRHGEIQTLHEQVGYWMFEPATSQVTLSLATARGQVGLASGQWQPGGATFSVRAERAEGSHAFVSNKFLDSNFRTISFEMTVTLIDDDSWKYVREADVQLAGRSDHVRFRNEATLVRVCLPTANPMAQLP